MQINNKNFIFITKYFIDCNKNTISPYAEEIYAVKFFEKKKRFKWLSTSAFNSIYTVTFSK